MKSQLSRSYSELMLFPTFEERVNYLQTYSRVAEETFGHDRYINQILYRCREWKDSRRIVIARDLGMDLGVSGYDILGRTIVHHMNPITKDDILSHSKYVFDPEYLISTSERTHNIIHFREKFKEDVLIERSVNDTCPWKKAY